MRPTVFVRVLLLLTAAALAVSGCGKDRSKGASHPKGPQSVSAIPANEALIKDMGDDGTTLTEAGCSFGRFDEEKAEHVDGADGLDFSSFPPSSGTHYATWAPYGSYDKPIEDGYAVHDMEHGGVVVWLGTKVNKATTSAIGDLLDDGEKWVVAPRADIPGLYSAAWAKALSCPPTALAKLGPDKTAHALDTWYGVVASTGSDAEKDVPAYAGSMKEPTPKRDISASPPTS